MTITLKLEFTAQMKRDYQRMKKRGKDPVKLAQIIKLLQTGKTLPPNCRDHSLKGKWIGFRDCHIEDDWVLIYRIDQDVLTLIATRTGTHSDLGL